MENPRIDVQVVYLRKIFRELALLNILIFVGIVTLAAVTLLNWTY